MSKIRNRRRTRRTDRPASERARESGGTVALHGFLYQILAHIERVSRLLLAGERQGTGLSSARMVLEPRGGGGDARFSVGGVRTVEQYKWRSRAWTPAAFMEEVLPDLLRAAPSPAEQPSEYVLVTNADCAGLSTFVAFCRRVAAVPPERELPAALDGESTCRVGKRSLSDREIYADVLHRVEIETSSRSDVAGALREVLAGLRIESLASRSQLTGAIDGMLRGRVDALEDVESKRNELIAILFEQLSANEVYLTPGDLLRRANLVGIDLANNDAILARAHAVLERDERAAEYRPDYDVRTPVAWNAASAVLLVHGESGCGKTWALFSLAKELLRTGTWCVVVTSTGDAARDRELVAARLWQTCLGHTNTVSLDVLASRISTARGPMNGPWATILLDGVESAAVAREHLREGGIRASGLRLVLASTEPITRALVETASPNGIERTSVGEFSYAELRAYLGARGIPGSDMPGDVRDLLRRPVYAAMYCDRIGTGPWLPRSEYEILDRVWTQVRSAKSQSEHPFDEHVLLALSRDVLSDPTHYPWPLDSTRRLGMDDACLARLEGVGWLRRGPEGDTVEMPHLRLLAWAVAEAIASDYVSTRNPGPYAALVTRLLESPSSPVSRALDWSFADALWIVSKKESHSLERVVDLVESIPLDRVGWPTFAGFVEHVLPTLGASAVPVLTALLERSQGDPTRRDAVRFLVRDALAAVAAREPGAVRDAIAHFLGSEEVSLQDVGIALMRAAPSTSSIDRAWALHRERVAKLSVKETGAIHRYSTSAAAMRAAVRENPDWLRDRFRHAAEHQDPVHELVWLLLGLRGQEARTLWLAEKQTAFDLVREDHRVCLWEAVGRLRDVGELARVVAAFESSSGDEKARAFWAICVLDRDRAIRAVAELEWDYLYLWRSRWLPLLARVDESRLAETLLAKARREEEGWRRLALLYQGSEVFCPGEIVRTVVDGLERALEVRPKPFSEDDRRFVYHPLSFLCAVARTDALAVLRSCADGPLPVELLRALGPPRGGAHFDYIAEFARILLLRMESEEFCRFLEAEASIDDWHSRLAAAEWARASSSRTLLRRLRTLATEDPASPPERLVETRALDTLACLGGRRAVVAAIRRGSGDVSVDIPQLMSVRRNARASAPRDVLDDLASKDIERRRRAITSLYALGAPPLDEAARGALLDALEDASSVRPAAVVLLRVGEASQRYVESLGRMLDGPFSTTAVDLLRAVKSPLADEVLIARVRRGPRGRVDEAWWEAVESLDRRGGREQFVTESVRSALAGVDPIHVPDGLLSLVATSDPMGAERLLYAEAWGTSSSDRRRRLEAAEALAVFDRSAALEVAIQLLREHLDSRIRAAKLALRIGGTEGARSLLTLAERDQRPSVAFAVARALRWARGEVDAESLLRPMLGSDDSRTRRTACDVAGWLDGVLLDELLAQVEDADADEEVRLAASAAIRRRRTNAWAKAMVGELGSASRMRRWSIVSLLVAHVDPHLLASSGDALFLGSALGRSYPAFSEYLDRQFDSRRREVDQQEGNLDKRRAER